jgi:hypothetical protein
MEYVAVALVGGWSFTTYLFVKYMRSRDNKEQHLLNRIQAPEIAVMESHQVEPATVSYAGEERSNGHGTD